MGDGSFASANTTLDASSSAQQSQPACQEPADSTNLFVGVPIKQEPLDYVPVSEAVRNEEDKSLPAAEDRLDPYGYRSLEGSRDESCVESISQGVRDQAESQSGNNLAISHPNVKNELDPVPDNYFGDSTEGSSPESSSDGRQNSGDCRSEDGLAILRQMADEVGEASEKDRTANLEINAKIGETGTGSESEKPLQLVTVEPDINPAPEPMEVDEITPKNTPEKGSAENEQPAVAPDSVVVDEPILRNVLLKGMEEKARCEEKKAGEMTLDWKTGELGVGNCEELPTAEKTNSKPQVEKRKSEMALNWKTGELEMVEKEGSQKAKSASESEKSNSPSAENGVVYNLKVKTDLGQKTNPEPRRGGSLMEAGTIHREPMTARWGSQLTPGRITSVKGSADAVWRSQFSMSSPWTDRSHDTVEFKEEPLSPSGEASDPFTSQADSKDRSYNLRPRVEAVVHYGEVEDWLEEVDTPPPRPARQRVTPWKCFPCQLYFTSSYAVQAHQASHQCLGMTMESFSCQICLKKFFSESDLAEHNLIHLKIAYNFTADDLSSCMKCDLSFADPKRFRQHKAMHDLKKMPSQATQYPCSECGLVFIKKTTYESHLISHNAPARATRPPSRVTHSVPVVVPAFSDTANYKTPMQATNNTERDFACSLCIERFKSEDLLYDHRFAFHGIPDERVACNTCSVKFRGPAALEEHIKVAHSSRAVARKTTKPSVVVQQQSKPATPLMAGCVRCRRCGLVCSSQKELQQHEISKHKNPSPYWCRTCRQRFPTRSLLLIHHRTHSSVVISPQSEPADERSQSPNVVRHLETSRKGKQKEEMTCKSCVVTFRVESDLKQHKASHSKFGNFTTSRFRHLPGHIYRYQCSGCPQMFSAKESLSRHLVHVHAGEDLKFLELIFPAKREDSNNTQVECEICCLKVSSQAGLNFHMRKKHSQLEIPEKKKKVLAAEQGSSEVCPFCSGTFAASYIQRHINTQHGGMDGGKTTDNVVRTRKPLQCRYCPRVCNTRYNLKRHEHAHGSRGRPDWICVCGKSFHYRFKTNYLRHRRRCSSSTKKLSTVAVAEAPPTPPESAPPQSTSLESSNSEHHACSVCLNSYETQSLLELHTMTAHGMAVFGDAEGSVRERELWREEANKIVREVEGEHRCTLCRVHFESLEAAAWHRAQHPRGNLYVVQIDDSLYQCTVCDQLFDGREVALRHAAQHAEADVKPSPAELNPQMFNCPFCSSTFTSEDSIRSHIFYVHPGGSANTI